MIKGAIYLVTLLVHQSLIQRTGAVIYTYEDVELRRLFPSEFPQDTVRKTGNLDPEHLGRYEELRNYFMFPKSKLNSHFEELVCYDDNGKRVCNINQDRYTQSENEFFMSGKPISNIDPRRVYCIFLICFTKAELNEIVDTF